MPPVAPDLSRDIVVHRYALVDALTGDALGDRWTIWIGPESEGSFDAEADALAAAVALARERGRPAWLHRDGHAIQRIDT